MHPSNLHFYVIDVGNHVNVVWMAPPLTVEVRRGIGARSPNIIR